MRRMTRTWLVIGGSLLLLLGAGGCRAGIDADLGGDPEDGLPGPGVVLTSEAGFCGNLVDDDGDGLVDCLDPDCQPRAACNPGTKHYGEPCTHHNECASNGRDPLCLKEAQTGFPGGYCSEFCGND